VGSIDLTPAHHGWLVAA